MCEFKISVGHLGWMNFFFLFNTYFSVPNYVTNGKSNNLMFHWWILPDSMQQRKNQTKIKNINILWEFGTDFIYWHRSRFDIGISNYYTTRNKHKFYLSFSILRINVNPFIIIKLMMICINFSVIKSFECWPNDVESTLKI